MRQLSAEIGTPAAAEGDPGQAPQTHPTNIPIPRYQTVLPLQSLPGATAVLYLDFDGEKGPFPVGARALTPPLPVPPTIKSSKSGKWFARTIRDSI